MRVREENKMVGIGLCERGDQAISERKRETKRGWDFVGLMKRRG